MPCKYDLLIIGDAVLDLYFNIKSFPVLAGTTNISPDMQISPGGPVALAIIASKLGLNVAFCDQIGSDIFGEYIKQKLQEAGISTEYVLMENDISTPISINIVDADKNHSFIGYLGSGDSLNYIDKTIIQNSDAIFFEGYNLTKFSRTYKTILNVAETARLYKKYIFFDPGPLIKDIKNIEKFMEISDTVFLNQEELLDYVKLPLNDSIEYLMNKNNGNYVLKLGKQGSVLIAEKKKTMCKSIKTEKIKNTIGAGDAFDAGYMAALLKGYDRNTACIVANTIAHIRLSEGINVNNDLEKIIEIIKMNYKV